MPERNEKSWTIGIPHKGDAEAMAQMQAQSWQDTYIREGEDLRNNEVLATVTAFVSPERLEKRRQLIEEAHADVKKFMRVAKDNNDEVVGLLFGSSGDDLQELIALYVDKRYHGTGLAKQLVEEFIIWCDPSRPIELGVLDDNMRAQAFYKKIGFHAVKDSRHKFQAYEHIYELKMIKLPQEIK